MTGSAEKWQKTGMSERIRTAGEGQLAVEAVTCELLSVPLSRFDGNLTGNRLFSAANAPREIPQNPDLRHNTNGIPVNQ